MCKKPFVTYWSSFRLPFTKKTSFLRLLLLKEVVVKLIAVGVGAVVLVEQVLVELLICILLAATWKVGNEWLMSQSNTQKNPRKNALHDAFNNCKSNEFYYRLHHENLVGLSCLKTQEERVVLLTYKAREGLAWKTVCIKMKQDHKTDLKPKSSAKQWTDLEEERRGLITHYGRGKQLRTIQGRVGNKTQVNHIRRVTRGSRGRHNTRLQNKTGNTKLDILSL